MEILYYYLRYYDIATAYTNPYVNLYLSDYGKIVNNYDGTLSSYKYNNALLNNQNLGKPFAILPVETSIIYPVGFTYA